MLSLVENSSQPPRAHQACFSAATFASAESVRLALIHGAFFATFEHEAAAAAKAVCAYNRDGVAVVRSVVSNYLLEALRRGCEEAQDEAGPSAQCLNAPADAGPFFNDLTLKWLANSIHLPRSRCTSRAQQLPAPLGALRPFATFVLDQLFIKEAEVSVPTSWH